jgi:hypothetical protein
MLKAMYEEAHDIAITSDQVTKVDSFAVEAAYTALALDPNGPAKNADLDTFIREHLK